MNLDELQSVQSKERQATSLQDLRPSFYREAGEFIQELTRERDRAAEQADDPFSSPEVQRLSDDLQTAKQTVEALYERRVGKVVKMASIAAAGMPADDDGLTEEEAALFDALVARIQENRGHVLDEVLEGQSSSLSAVRDEGVESSDGVSEGVSSEYGSEVGNLADDPPGRTGDAVDVADMMGPESDVADDDAAAEAEPAPESPTRTEVPADGPPPGESSCSGSGSSSGDRGSESPAVDRTTVRMTRDVGEIFGVDERTYDLSADEVVTLPAANADPLVERDAAERLE